MVTDEKDNNNETMAEGEEGGDAGVWMDSKDEPPDDLRYSKEVNKIVVLPRIMQKTVLKRAITALARSEAKPAIQLRSQPHRPRLST